MVVPLVDLKSALDAAIAAMPGSLRYKGVTVTCSVTELEQTDDVDEAGVLNESELEVTANRDDFTAGIPQIRLEQVEVKQSAVDTEWTAYHVMERKIDAISVTLGLMRA